MNAYMWIDRLQSNSKWFKRSKQFKDYQNGVNGAKKKAEWHAK